MLVSDASHFYLSQVLVTGVQVTGVQATQYVCLKCCSFDRFVSSASHFYLSQILVIGVQVTVKQATQCVSSAIHLRCLSQVRVTSICLKCYGVATICRLLKMTGLFCKRAI